MSKERELLVHALDRLKHINYEDDHLTNDLIQTIQKLLAQPEQENLTPRQGLAEYKKGYAQAELDLKRDIEHILAQPEQDQEPVAWRWETHKHGYYIYSEENYHDLEGEPLYTTPPKREPLSEDETAELWGESYSGTTKMVRDFARAIEKAHGIGETE